MKAIIFSCSLKRAENSDSQAWSDLMAKMMNEQSIQTEIINLRKFDHEASTGADLLHKEMAKCYDADLIVLAAPVNFRNINFYVRNLAERFTHAHNKAKAKGIDLFEGKFFETCIMHGCKNDHLADGTEVFVPYGGKFHSQLIPLLPEVNYIQVKDTEMGGQLPNRTLNLRVNHSPDPHGPKRTELASDAETLLDIQNTIDAFKRDHVEHTPKFSLDTWMECFSLENPNAFGRGFTLSIDNLNRANIEQHIKWVNEHFTDSHHKAQILVSMKERCCRADYYEGAELYFDEQLALAEEGKTHAGDHYDTEYSDPNATFMMAWKKEGFRITRAANYRPNNY